MHAVWLQAIVLVGVGAILHLPLSAQRSVAVQLATLGVADVCGDRRVVVTISLDSPLQTSDSLLLFEFAVGYDPTKLQFIAPLFSGTLAEDTDYNGSGAIDSATIRVWAFNVTQPLRGTGPLCAVLFRYRGDCPDTTTVRIAYQPEKNQEAKIVFGSLGSALVEAVEQVNSNRSLTAQFPDTVLRTRVMERRSVQLRFALAAGTRLRQLRWRLRASGSLSIENVRMSSQDSVQLVIDTLSPNLVVATVSSPSPLAARDVVVECSFRLVGEDTSQLRTEIVVPACACVGAIHDDTLIVVADRSSAVHESIASTVRWIWTGSAWELHAPFGQHSELIVWDALGRQLYARDSIEQAVIVPVRCDWCAVLVRLQNGAVYRTILSNESEVR